MVDDDEIASEVYSAIAATLAQDAPDGRKLAGYALLTDDALETLSYATIWRRDGEQVVPDLLFSPVDWCVDLDDAPFRSAAAMLRRGLAKHPLSEHVDLSFHALVSAAKRAS